MTAPHALVLDFLDWLAAGPRPYRDSLDAWRTSCPRLPIWEDAFDHGFVRHRADTAPATVELTSEGRAFLRAHRPQ